MNEQKTEFICCPYCNTSKSSFWASDNGFNSVKCDNCNLVYVNPRPVISLIDDAVRTGTHSEEANSKNVVTRRINAKIEQYKGYFISMFDDVWRAQKPISWLDIGAGFGEIIEAIIQISPKGSDIQGLEPMMPKAEEARKRGLNIQNGYIDSVRGSFDFISLVNVFSHIPDFRAFLLQAKKVLNPYGEIFIETGNAADLTRIEVPGELSLPDHLVFAGESHMKGYLIEAGFEIIEIRYIRIDTWKEFFKDLVKFVIGRPIILAFPFKSPYRSLLIRARLKSA